MLKTEKTHVAAASIPGNENRFRLLFYAGEDHLWVTYFVSGFQCGIHTA